MNIDNFITKLREIVKENTNISEIYTPDLPQEKENIACITILTSENINSLCGTIYNKFGVRFLIRGTENDKETRKLADSLFKYINMLENITFEGGKLILIVSNPPIYAFRDENNRIYYNISATCTVEWEV